MPLLSHRLCQMAVLSDPPLNVDFSPPATAISVDRRILMCSVQVVLQGAEEESQRERDDRRVHESGLSATLPWTSNVVVQVIRGHVVHVVNGNMSMPPLLYMTGNRTWRNRSGGKPGKASGEIDGASISLTNTAYLQQATRCDTIRCRRKSARQ